MGVQSMPPLLLCPKFIMGLHGVPIETINIYRKLFTLSINAHKVWKPSPLVLALWKLFNAF